MLDGLLPESAHRELVAQDGGTSEQKNLADTYHSAGTVVQRQRVVDHIHARLDSDHVGRPDHEEGKANLPFEFNQISSVRKKLKEEREQTNPNWNSI